MYIIFCAICFTFIFGFLNQNRFFLCNKNCPWKHSAFQEQMKRQPQQIKRVETCSASVFSTPFSLRKISAYFYFCNEIPFCFFGSKFKETKVADAAPPGHLMCSFCRFTKQTRNGKLQASNGGRNYHTDDNVVLSMPGPLPNPVWLGIVI